MLNTPSDKPTGHFCVMNAIVLLRISKSCKRTDSDGFFKKSADPDADSDSGVLYRIYSRISRKIDHKIMPQKLGGDLSPGLY